MSAVIDDTRRRRVLAELGLVRYRLRTPAATIREATDVAGAAASTPAVAEDAPLRVTAPDATSAPVAWPEAMVWSQVLSWLGFSAHEVRWQGGTDDGDGQAVLPATATWATPEGKRGLWLALKGHVRKRN